MKKWTGSLLTLSACLLFINFTSFGQPDQKFTIKVNSVPVSFTDVGPFIDEKSRIQIPIRSVSEILEAKLDWNGAEKKVTITKNDVVVTMIVGECRAIKNGKEIFFDTCSILKNGRTFLPLRALSETLGVLIKWDQASKTAILATDYKYVVSDDFRKVLDNVKNTVMHNEELLLFSRDGKASLEHCDFSLGLGDKYYMYLRIENNSPETLNAVKELLKVYYPNQYEEVYKKALEIVNGPIGKDGKLTYSGTDNLYFEERYFGGRKFENGTVIDIGKEGEKYE
ncbi:MAG: copper amine oxidase N-terminal domain-containing protein [Clostridia bacterium]|nr:copper amine oxidase N-terminal domain-containing protein [Clostridia bacterium]